MTAPVWLWLYDRAEHLRHFTWARYERAQRRAWHRRAEAEQ